METLVTKLKGQVSGSFMKLGDLYLPINTTTHPNDNKVLRIGYASYTNERILEAIGGNFLDSSSVSIGKYMTVTANSDVYIDSNVSGVIIPDKYNLTVIYFFAGTCEVDNLDYTTNLIRVEVTSPATIKGELQGLLEILNGKTETIINIEASGFVGNLSAFSSFTSPVKTMTLRSNGIYGDISSLYNVPILPGNDRRITIRDSSLIVGEIDGFTQTSLASLGFRDTNVGGTIEGLANSMFNAGKTSGQLSVNGANTQITYNNVLIGSSTLHIQFTENGWTVS